MKELNSGVYMIINQVNQKVYVGSSRDLKGRGKKHFSLLRKNKHTNTYLQQSFNKYGEENFKLEILKYCKENQLLKWEQHFMNKYNSANHDCGYNLEIRADRKIISEESRRKSSISHKGKISGMKGKKHSEESKRKMSLSRLGEKQSEETKKKRSKALKGRKFSPEHIEKMKKRIVTVETREKIRKGHLGKKHTKEHIEKNRLARLGKKFSEEARKRMSISRKGKKLTPKGILHNEKLKELNTGSKRSLESREKMRQAQLGKKLTEEHKKKISESLKKRYEKKELIYE